MKFNSKKWQRKINRFLVPLGKRLGEAIARGMSLLLIGLIGILSAAITVACTPIMIITIWLCTLEDYEP
jgi:hypothetical protein